MWIYICGHFVNVWDYYLFIFSLSFSKIYNERKIYQTDMYISLYQCYMKSTP